MMALKYIQWIEKENPGLKLQYMLRGGEFQISTAGHRYKVDAYNKETKEVYEINGCIWHGCPKCLVVRDKINPVCGKTPHELYARTVRKEDEINAAGYTVHSIWECEIREMMEESAEMKKFFKLNQYTRRLNPREAEFGGRTQVFRAITDATDDTCIDYYDFVSMYPYLNAGGTSYPRGNPAILIDEHLPRADQPLVHRGIVFCDVLPAKDSPLGYLPGRFHHKLMFTLCRACAEDQNVYGECQHRRVSERYLTGVWTTDELKKAVSRGYRVLRYHEIWHWPDKDWTKDGGFFAKYIRPLLKKKYEASGWPRENMSDDEKEEYMANILEKDGVEIDPVNVKKNPAIRSMAKIFLNSCWGKFAQNPVRNETRLILKSDAARLTNFFNDPLFEPTAMKYFGEKKLWVSRKPKRETVQGAPFTNLPIGIITPSAGRLRLLEGIERVGVENMIYCDTDSLMFKRKTWEDPLGDLKGENLGYLVSEIPEGKKIESAVCIAPKAYSIQIREEVTEEVSHITKAKGITMHCENSQRINYTDMRKIMTEFIEDGMDEPLEGEIMLFKRGEHAFDGLWTCISKKQMKPNMDKGHFVEGIATPFDRVPSDTVIIDDYPFY